MVTNVTSYSGNGLKDWLLQRVSAYVLGLYVLFLLGVYFYYPTITFSVWQGLFSQLWVKVFTLLAFISVVLHAWIGIWTVLTDYVKVTGLRLIIEAVFMLALVSYLIWAIVILWSV